ncbi:signal peptide peptidase-like 2B [Haemaphysalis longicornis]
MARELLETFHIKKKGDQLPSGAVPCCHGSLEVRQLLVIIVGFIVPAIWVYIRHDEYSWVLQDSLGVLFSVYILRIMRMPSMKRGDSIMVEVATGGGSKEQIPMLMRVPRFGNQELNACLSKYQLLGFGDILIPGYALGLIATFAGLYLMRMSQPALLYLVPFTVLPVLCLAWCRGELHDMCPKTQPKSEMGKSIP